MRCRNEAEARAAESTIAREASEDHVAKLARALVREKARGAEAEAEAARALTAALERTARSEAAQARRCRGARARTHHRA